MADIEVAKHPGCWVFTAESELGEAWLQEEELPYFLPVNLRYSTPRDGDMLLISAQEYGLEISFTQGG